MKLRTPDSLLMGFLASALGACTGGSSAPAGMTAPDAGGSSADGNTPTDANSPTDTNTPPTPSCVGTPAGLPIAVPLQRINEAQYNAIVSDLFAAKITVPINFPPPLGGYSYTTYVGANPMGEGQAQAVLEAAEAVAMQVADLVPACTSVTAEPSCATTYLQGLTTRAFRRPATSEELAVVMAAYTRARPTLGYQESVAIAVETVLQMPQFLYVLETQPLTPQSAVTTLTGPELAQRMALLYWNGLPDKTLLDAAQSGALADPANRLTQARRMMQDPRAHIVFSDFLRQWLTIRNFRAEVHPADLQAALDEQMRRDIDHALAADSGLHELLASNRTFVNSVLEKFYGLPAQSAGPTDWRQVDMGSEQRVGLLTHPLLLAKFAHGLTAAPILRGKFIRLMVLCDNILPPPPGAQAAQEMLSPAGATVRQQSQARIDSAACGGCHRLMDPIGFGFSAFDGAGSYGPTAGGTPVDAIGHVYSTSPELDGEFNGVRQLGDKLAASPKVEACLATQWMRYALGTQETTADQCTIAALAARFGQQNHSLQALFAELSALDSFAKRSALPEVKP